MKASYIVFPITGVIFFLIFTFLKESFSKTIKDRLITAIVASQVFVILLDQSFYFIIILLFEFYFFIKPRANALSKTD